MTEDSNIPDIDNLLNLFTDAIGNKFKAIEMENEALRMRLKEAQLKLELAKAKLEEAGIDTVNLNLNSGF